MAYKGHSGADQVVLRSAFPQLVRCCPTRCGGRAEAGRFDVSSLALSGAIFKFRALAHERHRSVSPCASLHLRHGDLDRDFWRALGAWHADRYFSIIAVISVIWGYTGLPPGDMANRVVAIYERSLSTTVNDIEHIELQSLPGYGIVKVFFQPTVNINAAEAQVTSISQTVLKQLPLGITPPFLLVYDASSVPIIQLALSSDTLSDGALRSCQRISLGPRSRNLTPGVQLPNPYGGAARQVQIDLDQNALRAHSLSATDIGNALARQNLITPVGTEKIGSYEYTIDLNDFSKSH